ncbi:alanine racemase [Pollutimonas bauzanensis]|uniref:Diaminopimelate decarboxylase n=1 Tax=Pollutimonas bauzanensis TaxID=658167 RepID=A0A1M5MAG0_9BURK|nr:alanine racemase [Pollutimonas bauzanensis]SHG74225.1 diaminopimelate decarboxylase [Pollutimonas bauzanensis]
MDSNTHYSASLASVPAAVSFPLTAHLHQITARLLQAHSAILSELTDGLGSPLHFVLPQVFRQNVDQFREVFNQHDLDGAVLFAKKANKADCFARAAALMGIGADVASTGELAKALAAGIVGEAIGVSGPEKDDALLALSLQHRCLVAIDSLHELERMACLAHRIGSSGRILLRCRLASQANSRFGLNPAEREAAIGVCLSHSEAIRLQGFSFHLGGYSTEERAQAASQMIDHCLEARSRGLAHCRHVDLGGGLAVQYVDPACWKSFTDQDEPSHYHAGKRFGGFYPYGALRAGPQALGDILHELVDAKETLASKARRHGIGIIVEPGRALLDQAGFTVFRVQAVKDRHASDGYAIVTVQGSSLSLSEQWFNSEYLPDPVLLGTDPSPERPFLACIAGSTCLEGDLLTWRKLGFPRAIRAGDSLVYLNTAGYQMDSNESRFHEARLPLKVVLDLHDDDTRPRWRLDDI